MRRKTKPQKIYDNYKAYRYEEGGELKDYKIS